MRLLLIASSVLLTVPATVSTGLDNTTVQPALSPLSPDDSLQADGRQDTTTAVEEPLFPLSSERQAKLNSYSRFRNIWRFADFLIGVGVLGVILLTGLSARMRAWAQAAIKPSLVLWLFLILFLLADYVLNLPFHVYRSFIVERHYGFLNQAFLQWWGEDLLALLVTAVIAVIPVWFFYRLVQKASRWWVWFSIGAIPLLILLIVIAPVFIDPLFNTYEPLKDQRLKAQILSLADKAGIAGSDVFEVNASKQSSRINAYVTGLFGTKRIVLYDTMIENFETDEIKFVMAHEIGHYVKHHVWQGLAAAVVFIALGLWLTNRTIHGVIRRFRHRFKFDRLADIASLPLVLAFLTTFNFVFQPLTNGFSRHLERQADRYALKMSEVATETAVTTFEKLSAFNLSDPDPHWLVEFWFYTHPALKKRIEAVRRQEGGPERTIVVAGHTPGSTARKTRHSFQPRTK